MNKTSTSLEPKWTEQGTEPTFLAEKKNLNLNQKSYNRTKPKSETKKGLILITSHNMI